MISTIKKHKRQLILFFIAGALSAAIEISSLLALEQVLPRYFYFETLGNGYPLSSVLATTAGIVSNYFFSIRYVFERGKHSKRKEFTLFIVLSIATVLMTWAVFTYFLTLFSPFYINLLLVNVRGDIIICRAAAIFLVSLINYIVKKKIIFSS